jgi:3-hydroxyisobutyrate dehydrogenase-like beta-hydroxyacid dehydrogenase
VLGNELKRLSIDLVDSPITQEKLHAIDTGGATLMVGADSEVALQRALPILRDMSSHVFPMGKLGAGHVMKTLNNYVSVGSIIALCDALVSLPLQSSNIEINKAARSLGRNLA